MGSSPLPRWSLIGPPALVAAVVSLCLAACTSTAGSAATTTPSTQAPSGNPANGSPVITPSAARALLAKTTATNNEANAKLSSSLLASYEAGSAYELDEATYEAERLAERESSFKASNPAFTIDLKALGLVRQTAWPADVLTIGIQKSLVKASPATPACGTMLDFARTASSGRWQIVLEPSTNASGLPHLATSSDGYLQPLSSTDEGAAKAVPGEVSKALLTEETSGKLGPFKSSDFTGKCWQLPNPRSDVISAEQKGFSQRDLYSPVSPADTSAFALRGGGELVMFTLRFEDQVLAASGAIAWSPSSVAAGAGGAWEYFLAAGSYSQVVEKGELQIAVEVAPGQESYSVVGAYPGITSVTGTKASSSTTTPSGTLTSYLNR
ncbi:MAG: hypothetical protein ACLPQS_01025 [Acidimicrobiales bacterium]